MRLSSGAPDLRRMSEYDQKRDFGNYIGFQENTQLRVLNSKLGKLLIVR